MSKQLNINVEDDLIVDNFAGGGGASTGIEMALGRSVDVAINHDQDALAMHRANHPQTRHLVEDVFHVDPVEVTYGRAVGLYPRKAGGYEWRPMTKTKQVRMCGNSVCPVLAEALVSANVGAGALERMAVHGG